MIPIKTAQEVEKMRASCRLASQVLDAVSAMIYPGVTTREVDLAAAKLMADAGCRSAFLGYKRFPGNICISINDEVVHGIGGPRRIQYGDLVKLDIGVILSGFVGDTAATVPVGVIYRGGAEAVGGHGRGFAARALTKRGKGVASASFARRSRMKWRPMDSVWCESLSAMAWDAICTRNRRSLITGLRVRPRNCRPA